MAIGLTSVHEIMSLVHRKVLGTKRRTKRLILTVTDFLLCTLSLWYAYFLRTGGIPAQHSSDIWWIALICSLTGVSIFWALGLYDVFMRTAASVVVITTLVGSSLLGILILALNVFDPDLWIPWSIPLIYPLVLLVAVTGVRVVGRLYFRYANRILNYHEPVVIYGAGALGTQLAAALDETNEYRVVGFVDDDPLLSGTRILGKRVWAQLNLQALIDQYPRARILLAIKNLSPEKKRVIVQQLSKFSAKLVMVPGMSDIVTGARPINALQRVRIDQLLGRKTVKPVPEIFENAIRGKCILVTGAGGSIGSEICRQVVSGSPSKLVMFDQSEIALYQLEREFASLPEQVTAKCEVVFMLGDCANEVAISNLFASHSPQIVYHAAAYKHVPIVEDNIAEGLNNNIFSTVVVARQALLNDAQRFVLISTDKAVRPTNVMGASKRVAEQVVQSMAIDSRSTVFSIVRFGNVLDSSGSVIPLFRRQINEGGPVTVTHKDVVRYFMTIPEAAQLVVQAGFISKGGEVFVLEMGMPVNILELARLMIQLSDFSEKSESNPAGDIEIKITGLRPGEKLFEELLIEGETEETIHPKIVNAIEVTVNQELHTKSIKNFQIAIEHNDTKRCRALLRKLVEGYSG